MIKKFLKKLVYPLVTNGLKQGGMSGNRLSMVISMSY